MTSSNAFSASNNRGSNPSVCFPPPPPPPPPPNPGFVCPCIGHSIINPCQITVTSAFDKQDPAEATNIVNSWPLNIFSQGGAAGWFGTNVNGTNGFQVAKLACDTIEENQSWYYGLTDNGTLYDGTPYEIAVIYGLAIQPIPNGPAIWRWFDTPLAVGSAGGLWSWTSTTIEFTYEV